MKPECNFRQLKYNSARLAIMKYIAETGIQVGDRLPPERKLVKRLSCSAITMRHALADMESVGLTDLPPSRLRNLFDQRDTQ